MEDMNELINETLSKSLSAAQQMQMQSIVTIISFPLKGHQIVMQGTNPDLVIKAVELMKKNSDRLSKVDDNWHVSFPVNLTRPQVKKAKK